ncbi:MAG: CHAP domain-containing protein, partial [Lachnospiraceae bacterium]
YAQRWWYVQPGYTYPVSEWMEYNGTWFYIDNKGWMARDTYVKSVDRDVYYWLDGTGAWDGKDYADPDLEKYQLTV